MISPTYWSAHSASIHCLAALAEKGLTVRPTTDSQEIRETVKGVGKSYLTPMLDPALNDFTEDCFFWLVAYLEDKPAIVGGGRLDVIPSRGDSFLKSQLVRGYGENSISSIRPDVSKVLQGRVCYLGDLYSRAGLGLSQNNRKMFLGVANYIASVHFRADLTYSLMRQRDIYRGSADVNGFDGRLKDPVEWGDAPEGRGDREVLVFRRKASDRDYFESLKQE